MSAGKTALLIGRELSGSLRSRWFYVYSAVFLIGGVLTGIVGLGDTVIHGYRGFARAFAGLVHLSLIFVPLMALVPASSAVVEEKENGSLDYLLAQPVSHTGIFVGKWAGISVALLLSLTIGMGANASIAVWRGVPFWLVGVLFLLVLLLALCFVGVGLCFSAIASSRARAMTLGFVCWLVLASLGSLGIIVSFIRWGVPAEALTMWTFINPMEAFRIGVVSVLDPDLSLLGPIGVGLVESIGHVGTAALATTSLALWSIAPGLLGMALFRRAL